MQKGDAHDPKGLIFEAYRIDGITKSECRTIFLDWALSLPDGLAPVPAIDGLLARYGADHADHPMTDVLREGRAQVANPNGAAAGAAGRARNRSDCATILQLN